MWAIKCELSRPSQRQTELDSDCGPAGCQRQRLERWPLNLDRLASGSLLWEEQHVCQLQGASPLVHKVCVLGMEPVGRSVGHASLNLEKLRAQSWVAEVNWKCMVSGDAWEAPTLV